MPGAPHVRTKLGSFFSKGAQAVWLKMAERPSQTRKGSSETMADVARNIGVEPSAGHVARWLYGDRIPTRHDHVEAFRTVYGVEPGDWAILVTDFTLPAAPGRPAAAAAE